eukprot:44305_1
MGVCAYDVLRHRTKPMDIHQRRINAQNISCVKLPKPQIRARTNKTVKQPKKNAKKARPHLSNEAEITQRNSNLQRAQDMESDLKEAQDDDDYKPNVKIKPQPLRRSER